MKRATIVALLLMAVVALAATVPAAAMDDALSSEPVTSEDAATMETESPDEVDDTDDVVEAATDDSAVDDVADIDDESNAVSDAGNSPFTQEMMDLLKKYEVDVQLGGAGVDKRASYNRLLEIVRDLIAKLRKQLVDSSASLKRARAQLKDSKEDEDAIREQIKKATGKKDAAAKLLASARMQVKVLEHRLDEAKSHHSASVRVADKELAVIAAEKRLFNEVIKLVDMVLAAAGEKSGSRRLLSADEIDEVLGVSTDDDESFADVAENEQLSQAEKLHKAATIALAGSDVKQAKAIRAVAVQLLNSLKEQEKEANAPIAANKVRIQQLEKQLKAAKKAAGERHSSLKHSRRAIDRLGDRLARMFAKVKEAKAYLRQRVKSHKHYESVVKREIKLLRKMEGLIIKGARHAELEEKKKL